ncbi:MAG: DUF6387 family protein [Gallionellaceae bacterium]|jgi:hypothetical protein
MPQQAKKIIIRSADELPTWFSLDNYKELENFEYEQWLSVITVRYDLNVLYKMGLSKSSIEGMRKSPQQVFGAKSLDEIINGSKAKNLLKGEITAERFPLPPNIQPPPLVTHTVQSLSFRDAIGLTHHLEPVINNPICIEAFKYLEKAPDPLRDEPPAPLDDPNTLSEQPYDLVLQRMKCFFNANAHVVIDLYSSDKQILADMEIWLREFRKAANIPQLRKFHFSHKKISDWISCSLIPYLDLFLWSKYENVAIPNAIMCRAIFDYSIIDEVDFDRDADNRLRKGTLLTASDVLSVNGFNSLFKHDYKINKINKLGSGKNWTPN